MGGARTRGLRAATVLACLGLTVAVAAGEQPELLGFEGQAARRDVIEDALLLGLRDPSADDGEESGDRTQDVTPILRARRISIFADRDAKLVGRPLADAGIATGTDCPADYAATSRPQIGPDGVVAAGVEPVETRLPRTRRIYMADDGGRIAGLGTAPARGRAWKGYARAAPGSGLTAYALSDGGRLCRMGRVTVATQPASERAGMGG